MSQAKGGFSENMFPYILTYATSCFFLYIGLRYKSNKVLNCIFIGIALLLPALLAGMRDSSVGTDTSHYIRYFEYVKDTGSRVQNFKYLDLERGFGVFLYLISRFTNNVFWMLFLSELFICFFVWKAIDDNVSDQYKVFSMVLYYLLFYSFSFNIMRQMMAMSILLFSYRYIKKRELFKFLICVVIASLFHTSAIIGFALYPIYGVCMGKDSISLQHKKTSQFKLLFRKVVFKLRFLLILVGLCLAVFLLYNGKEVIKFISDYFNDFHAIAEGIGGSGSPLRYTLYMILLLICTAYTIQFARTEYMFYIVIFLLSIILYQIKFISTEAYRVAMYFSLYIVILIPQIIATMPKKTNRTISSLMVFIIICIYSYDFFVIQQYNGTYPYLLSMN